MKKIAIVLLSIVPFIFSEKINAWGTTGHRVIAEIAERNLNENTKQKIADLLDNQHMAYWANWADFIKADTTKRWNHTYIWHFVNAPEGLTKDQYISALKDVKQQNLYSQIPYLIDILKNSNAPKEEKKEALLFLIHLVGDMHQPMHTGRGEDRGGNDIKVQWFWQDTNLHSLWDTKLVDFEKYSYTEYATVLDVMSDEQKHNLQNGNLDDWFFDSHQIADKIYSLSKNGDNLSFDYNYKVRPIVDQQLQKGGMRLAKILDEIFNQD